MSSNFTLVTSVALPAASRLTGLYASTNLADAFSIRLPAGAARDPEVLAQFIFAQQAPWVHALMRLRDALVAGFGLKTAKQLATLAGEAGSTRLGIFRIYSRSEAEIVLGEDDKHLDFRTSVLCCGDDAAQGERHLVLSTVVRCHNRLGRAYIALIAPFHRLVVRSSLHRAARQSRPGRWCTAVLFPFPGGCRRLPLQR